MFENNDFEKGFREQLTRTQEFHNADKQWEKVYSRLSKKRRSRWLWFFPMLLTAVIFIFGFYTINNNDLNETSIAEVIPSKQQQQQQQQQSTNSIANLPDGKISVSERRSSIDYNDSVNEVLVNKEKVASEGKEYARSVKYIDSLSKECNCDPNLERLNDPNEWNNSDNIQSMGKPLDSDYSYAQIVTSDVGSKSSTIAEDELNSIMKPNYEKLGPLEIKKPNHLEYMRSLIENDLTPFSDNHVSLLNQKNYSFGLEAGLFSQAILRDSLVDNRNIGYAVGLFGQYEKVSLKIGYKNHKVDRVIKSDIVDYDITDLNFVYSTSSPDSVYLDYTNHLIDLSFGYEILSRRGLTWNVLVGGQSRLIKEGNAKLVYGGAYGPLIGEGPIPSTGFELSAVRLGSSFEATIYKSIGLKAEYNLALPLATEVVNWPRRHQFELGIVYHLYRRR